jgi:DNA-binding FrmR family transcriptional regulator
VGYGTIPENGEPAGSPFRGGIGKVTEQQVGQAHGYIKEGDKEKLRHRLRRIEGQVRGVQRMIEEEKYCVDILTQISSYIAASEKVASLVLKDHMEHCVRAALEDGNLADEKIQELTEAVDRFIKLD